MLAPTQERPFADHASFEKRSLASVLRAEGRVPAMVAVDIALDICDALASAHVHGIVHGDLGLHRVRVIWPPERWALVPSGPRVDIFTLGEVDSAPFGAGHLVPPEQRLGRLVDTRADIWAIGALLHCLISGRSPSGEPITTALAGAPRPLMLVVRACLSDDPAKRPQSVDELAEALASFSSSPPDRYAAILRRRSQREVVNDAAPTVVRTVRMVDEQADIATVLADCRYPRRNARSSASLEAMVIPREARRRAVSTTIDPRPVRRSPGAAFVYAAAALAVACGMGLGMHLMDYVMASRAPASHTGVASTPVAVAPPPETRPAPAPPAATPVTTTAAPQAPTTTTPAQLPDARSPAASSAPDARRTPPRPALRRPVRAKPAEPRPESGSAPAPTSEEVTVTPSSLTDALR